MKDKLSRKRVRSFAKKVQPIYEHLGWKVIHSDGEMRVPSVGKIIDNIDQLYRHIDLSEDSNDNYVASGGIKISVEENMKVGIEMTVPERKVS